MPCIKCISGDLRDLLTSSDPKIVKILEGVEDCADDSLIEFEQEGKKKKKKPSEYNNFVGVCMKSGKGMGDCAKDWKVQKEK